MLPEPVEDAVPEPICATFAEYVAHYRCGKVILLLKPRRLALILPCSNYCNKGTLTYYASDGGYNTVPGWVIGTNDEVIWECEGTARGYPMQSYRAEDTDACLFSCS
jgi:hypothetical protein